MRENADQNNNEYGHFSRNVLHKFIKRPHQNFPIEQIFLSNCNKLVILQTTFESSSIFSGFSDISKLNIKNVLRF